MTANVSAYANTFACQNPGKIFLLRTWQTVMDNNLSTYVQGLLMHMQKHLRSYLFKYLNILESSTHISLQLFY